MTRRFLGDVLVIALAAALVGFGIALFVMPHTPAAAGPAWV